MPLDLCSPAEPSEPDPDKPRIPLRPEEAARPGPAAPTLVAARRRRSRTRGLRPPELALDIAQKVSRAWHAAHIGSRMDVPVGVVAVLSLLRPPDEGPDTADRLLSLGAPELLDFYRQVWGLLWISRPELVEWARPLHGWLDEETQDTRRLAAVQAVTLAALEAGQLELTGDSDPFWRSEADVLGFLVTELRSPGSREALGQIHSPPDIAELIARLTLSAQDFPEGAWLGEPTAGTGGLVRAAAQHLREAGRDPRDFVWAMNDLDPISSACCAVNAAVWDLGPRVLVSCRDTLHDGDGTEHAIADRAAIIARRNELIGNAHSIAATLKAIAEVENLITGNASQPKAS
ncbi:hypothetical protein AB5J52_48095 (plasmid) [Streptomyces sp. R39]|uniref:DNA methylase adenine-specific domain-containing protein n=1 Tax=Streptomyces sp. R39 TaxID=3238631 RepID=A0AB39R6B2_9ACTN